MAKQAQSRKSLTRDEALDKLREVEQAVTSQFADNAHRLEQFTRHLATVEMAVAHLFDEAERSAAERSQ
jgi:hypothetical protein